MRWGIVLAMCVIFAAQAWGAEGDPFLQVQAEPGPDAISFTAHAGRMGQAVEVKSGACRYAIFFANGRSAGIFGVLRYSEENQRWESGLVSTKRLEAGEYFVHFVFDDGVGGTTKKRIYFRVLRDKEAFKP